MPPLPESLASYQVTDCSQDEAEVYEDLGLDRQFNHYVYRASTTPEDSIIERTPLETLQSKPASKVAEQSESQEAPLAVQTAELEQRQDSCSQGPTSRSTTEDMKTSSSSGKQQTLRESSQDQTRQPVQSRPPLHFSNRDAGYPSFQRSFDSQERLVPQAQSFQSRGRSSESNKQKRRRR